MAFTNLQNRDIILAICKTRSYLLFSNCKFNEFDLKKNRVCIFDRNPLQACQRH